MTKPAIAAHEFSPTACIFSLRSSKESEQVFDNLANSQCLQRKTTTRTTTVGDQQVQPEAGITETPAGITSSQAIHHSTCSSTCLVLYAPIASVQTDHPAEADSISHAATQLQNYVVDLPTNLTMPDYVSLALEGTISALLYASQCGVLSLE